VDHAAAAPVTVNPSPDEARDASPMSAAFLGEALLVVGWMRGDGSGFVEEYARRGGPGAPFERTQSILPEYSERMDAFGRHVTVTDCVMFVSDLTCVSVFFRTVAGAAWTRARTLQPAHGVPFLFGARTVARKDDLVIASPYERVGAFEYAGRVHVYPRTSVSADDRVALLSPRPDEDEQFGTDVTFDGTVLWVASRRALYGFDTVLSTSSPVATVRLSNTVSICCDGDVLWAAGAYGLRSFSISNLLHARKAPPASSADASVPSDSAGDGHRRMERKSGRRA
jgi:hypothetical protein